MKLHIADGPGSVGKNGYYRSSLWFMSFLLVVVCMYLLLCIEPQRIRLTAPAVGMPIALVTSNAVQLNSAKTPSNGRKKILVYSNLFGSRTWPRLKQGQLTNYLESIACPVTNCDIIYDRSQASSSDALVFHARDMPSVKDLKSIERPLYQRWVYFISENPGNTGDPTPLNSLFNWTMTYRLDSDIYLPYAQFGPLKSSDPRPKKETNYAEGRSKLVAWMVSHCGLTRERYALKLQEYIPLEVAGGCRGKFKKQFNCGRTTCDPMIRQYKFYLAFENGFCHNYVTEKYWHWAIEVGTVPIVMGAGPYTDEKLVIPGSYINVEDFPTVKALADYLLYLDKNDTAYNEYFKWRQHYKVTIPSSGWPYEPFWTCRMCSMLHNSSYGTKIYDKLSTFWGTGPSCAGKNAIVGNILSAS